ncbi:MAG TPA: metal ABC transporter substrate-binding protein [Glutamicibacter sp.]|nr:metal ABC transporter substrate-binding protein [Glutamicibacter sp.]HJX78823.1 metal ABC transporter substrate-binding protein [Glutamicibacter sp.]
MVLTGCSASTSAEGIAPEDQRPVVLTTFTVLADIAQNVAGDHLRVESVTKLGSEIHGYEPTPDDLRRASHADLILDHGMNLEAWFEQFVHDNPAPHVTVSDRVTPINITQGAGEGKPNPHAWMSPLNVQTYVDSMIIAFSELDPAHADDFAANGNAYKIKLQAVHDSLVADLAKVPEGQRVLVSCEGAFSYLTRDTGLREKYLWAVNAESMATPRKVAAAIDYVREHQIPAVFCESTVSDAAMQRVVESTDARYGGTLYVDSLSEPDGPVPSYLDLITHDAQVIARALRGEMP